MSSPSHHKGLVPVTALSYTPKDETTIDSDVDHMLDAWEVAQGLSPTNAHDGAGQAGPPAPLLEGQRAVYQFDKFFLGPFGGV